MKSKLEAFFTTNIKAGRRTHKEALNDNERNAIKAIESEKKVIRHWRDLTKLAGLALDQRHNSFDFGLKYAKLFTELLETTESMDQ
jgi:hypothetical protein